MTPEQAADLAARTLAAIDATGDRTLVWEFVRAADRERVASDLAAIRHTDSDDSDGGTDAGYLRTYAAHNLRRTAALYGISP